MIDQEVIRGIIAELKASKGEVLEEIRKGLNTVRSGNQFKHNLTGKTSKSIDLKTPIFDGANLNWDFDSIPGKGLNEGIPAGKKVNIQKIIDWVGARYNLYGSEGKRMAYNIIKQMDRTFKEKRWHYLLYRYR